MSLSPPPTVAVLGAGVAGALLARTLLELGFEVTVYEKARGPGGRTSTRRAEVRGADLAWDHGASGFELRDPELLRLAEGWVAAGVLARRGEGFVGVPGANALARHLLAGLSCRYGVTVRALRAAGAGWELLGELEPPLGSADVVVVSAPAPQAAAILETAGEEGAPLAARLREARYRPALVALVALDPAWREDTERLELVVHPLLARLVRHRANDLAAWTLHASEDAAEARLEEEPARLAQELVEAARADVGMPVPAHVAGHRWRYARAAHRVDTPSLLTLKRGPSALRGLGACGDAFGGEAPASDVEAALRSALHLARALEGASR